MTVYDLEPGVEYEVVAFIQDFHGGVFTEGQRLRFVERNYLPHDDGHTLVFTQDRDFPAGSTREVRMYLQGTDHRDAVEYADRYFKVVVPKA